MVEGLDKFITHFEAFNEGYILIGGSACDWQFSQKAVPFRATKDLDIILIAEALSDDFVSHFWAFIKEGGYEVAEVGEKKVFYRFIKPRVAGFPKMIELFSRRPDLIKEIAGMHFTSIKIDEDTSSLSAILLDDEYYNFTLANTTISNGLRLANDLALICLKTKAFLNNKARKADGQIVQTDDIIKHKKDIIRLTATINPSSRIELTQNIKADLKEFIAIVQEENTDVKQILKVQGITNVDLRQIVGQLGTVFNLGL